MRPSRLVSLGIGTIAGLLLGVMGAQVFLHLERPGTVIINPLTSQTANLFANAAGTVPFESFTLSLQPGGSASFVVYLTIRDDGDESTRGLWIWNLFTSPCVSRPCTPDILPPPPFLSFSVKCITAFCAGEPQPLTSQRINPVFVHELQFTGGLIPGMAITIMASSVASIGPVELVWHIQGTRLQELPSGPVPPP